MYNDLFLVLGIVALAAIGAASLTYAYMRRDD